MQEKKEAEAREMYKTPQTNRQELIWDASGDLRPNHPRIDAKEDVEGSQFYGGEKEQNEGRLEGFVMPIYRQGRKHASGLMPLDG